MSCRNVLCRPLRFVLALVCTVAIVTSAQAYVEIDELQIEEATAYLGNYLDLDGATSTLMVGASMADTPGEDPLPSIVDTGQIIVYNWNGSQWGESTRLSLSNLAASNRVSVVNLDGDIAIASGGQASGAWIVERNEGGAGNWGEVKSISGSVGAQYGWSNDISGDTVIVGEMRTGKEGYIHVYQKDAGGAGNWGEVATLEPTHTPDDFFSKAVAIEDDVIVGVARRYGGTSPNRKGAAFLYRDDSVAGDWSSVTEIKLGEGTSDLEEWFSVDIEDRMVAVGASKANSGTGFVYVFEDTSVVGDWSSFTTTTITSDDAAAGDMLGYDVDIDEGKIYAGALLDDGTGSAFVFEKQAGTWMQTEKLTASNGVSGDQFGVALVADVVDGTPMVAVGALLADNTLPDSTVLDKCGGVYIYTAPVPEPGVLSLVGCGLLTLVYVSARKRRS